MVERTKLLDETATCSSFKLLFLFLLKLEMVASARTRNSTNTHSCYSCLEPLVGYSKCSQLNRMFLSLSYLADHSDSCKYLNVSSPLAPSFIKACDTNDNDNGYECRKVVISYRSVETYLRRDCVPKGLCAWKDKTQSMINTPVSDCVYTDERTQKLECIYCCDTPLCNQAISYRITVEFIIGLLLTNYKNSFSIF